MLALLTVAASLMADNFERPLTLMCVGGGSIKRSAAGYGDHVTVELMGHEGRIRVPDGMKPQFRYGGDDGWYKLNNVRYSDREIVAKFSLNFMNNPEVRLDRISGHISMTGKAGNFSGECKKYDALEAERAF